jgi:hypothetical protein
MSRKTHFAIAVLAVLLVGCVNAENKFDEFGQRVFDGSIADAFDGALANIEGEHFLAVHPNGNGAPLLVIATVTNFVESPAGATADFAFQPLTHDNFSPPRMESGNPLIEDGIEISTAGVLSFPIKGNLPGNTNPLTGQNIDADIVLDAVIISEDLWCGTATGRANQLVLSDATTFGATRVDPGTRGADLPTAVLRCPAGPADAGVPDANIPDAAIPDAAVPDAT